MPYSILKLDIIMSRWDEKDPLIGTCHDPVQILNMGKRGNVSVFSTECYKSMLASNVTGWPVTCECPDSGDQKAVLSAQRKKKSVIHKQNKETLPISAMGYNKESWPGVNLETTRKADSWGGRTATRFHQRHCFLPFRPAPYSYESLCTLPICLLLDNFKS